MRTAIVMRIDSSSKAKTHSRAEAPAALRLGAAAHDLAFDKHPAAGRDARAGRRRALPRAYPVEPSAGTKANRFATQPLLDPAGNHAPIAGAGRVRPHVDVDREDQRRAARLAPRPTAAPTRVCRGSSNASSPNWSARMFRITAPTRTGPASPISPASRSKRFSASPPSSSSPRSSSSIRRTGPRRRWPSAQSHARISMWLRRVPQAESTERRSDRSGLAENDRTDTSARVSCRSTAGSSCRPESPYVGDS